MEKEAEVTAEQKQLAEFIKATHNNLRRESEIYGADEAWRRHVARSDVLESYAVSMKTLATRHWASAVGSRQKVHCRIDWVKNQCRDYFLNNGEDRLTNREIEIKQKLGEEILQQAETKLPSQQPVPQPIKLLDVGSCYDPFREDAMFDVTAVDLAPSCPTVLKCDFLNVKMEETMTLENTNLKALPSNYFDAVVFSLFLEYLPCPKQRHECCLKAYKALRQGGILLIITPDSKHVHANAKFMKSWRLALSKLGMMRVSYEKLPHLHCLVYRKCIHPEVARRWAALQTITSDELFTQEGKIFIPQDFQDCVAGNNMVEDDVAFDVELLDEMPFNDSDGVL